MSFTNNLARYVLDYPIVAAIVLASSAAAGVGLRRRVLLRRQRVVQPSQERVLILGASSGVGRAIALRYAARGARVCVVGRREQRILQVKEECGDLAIGLVADFTSPEDMIRVRERVREEWQGVDTILVCAGVSSLQPVMHLTDAPRGSGKEATVDGIQEAVRISSLALQGNFMGPLVAALTFIPMLAQTSRSPSILQISSVAAIIAAPTRALYCSTKSASLSLYQSIAIEHPEISFSLVLPGTIEGDFRASAVDKGSVREADPNKHGLKADYVAAQCIQAVDRKTKMVVLPSFYLLGHFLSLVWPSITAGLARKKYNYTV